MARPPKLRKKNGYWMTKAGVTETYFGKVNRLSHADARRLFLDHLHALSEHKTVRRAAITVEILCRDPLRPPPRLVAQKPQP
jgi:hypothetical protein